MPTGFNRILLGVVFFGLCVGAAFGAGAAWGRTTAPKALAAATATTGAGARTGATGASGAVGASGTTGTNGTTGTTGGRGAFGASGAAGADATPGAGNGAGAAFARRPGTVAGVTGTVESVSGQTLTITPSGGATGGASSTPETVTLGSTAQVGTVTKGDTNSIKAGDSVLITGQRGSDGSLSATSVMVLPQGFLGQ